MKTDFLKTNRDENQEEDTYLFFKCIPRCFSFTSTQTSTTHAKLFDINTDDASKILDITS